MPNTREKLIYADDFLDLFYLASAGQDKEFIKTVEMVVEDTPTVSVITAIDITNGVTVQKWIPISERLPEEDGRYLVVKKIFNNSIIQDVLSFAKDGRKVDKYDLHRGWKNVWHYYDSEWGHITVDSVTHWMPLPEAPKGE